jgi:hypothetical protein
MQRMRIQRLRGDMVLANMQFEKAGLMCQGHSVRATTDGHVLES